MNNPMSETSLAKQIEALEVRIAYQDETIETLNKTVTAQWKQIDALTRAINNLTDRVQEAENGSRTAASPESPPPHY
jgi:SlyX protein